MVVDESKNAAHGVAKYLKQGEKKMQRAKVSGANGIRYVVPQKVAISEIDNNIEFFMRSGKVFGNCHIVVTADGHKIAQFKRSFILPAEMEKVTIPKLLLKDDIKEIMIEVVEGEHE